MKIPAFAHCYGTNGFTGQIDLDISETLLTNFYLINNRNITAIKGRFCVNVGHEISASHFKLKLDKFGVTINGSGTIKFKDETFITGYISIDDEYGPSTLSPVTLEDLYVSDQTWIKLTPGEKSDFIPDDPEAFAKRPFGFCHIYCAFKAEFLPAR